MVYHWVVVAILFLSGLPVFGEADRIAFVGGYRIFTMSADGSNRTSVAGPFSKSATDLKWSPDGTQLAMTMDQKDIYLLDYDVHARYALLVQGPYVSEPDWSPDGNRIAFTFFSSNSPEGPEIRIMDLDGSNLVTIARNAYHPAWSPDGHRIAYSSREFIPELRVLRSDIWVCDDDGTHPTQITTSPFIAVEPDWSPDGRKILFSGVEKEDIHVVTHGTGPETTWLIYQAYTIDLESRIQTKLTQIINPADSFESVGSPSWSPTGNQIVFVKERDIWIMDADGSNKIQLTNSTRDLRDDYYHSPTWWGEGLPTVVQSTSWGQLKSIRRNASSR